MKNDNHEKIEDFLNGNLDEQEAAQFQEELKMNPVLAEEYRVIKGLYETLDKQDQLEFLDVVEQAKQDYRLQHKSEFFINKTGWRNTRIMIFASAALVLLAMAIFILISRHEPPNYKTLFDKYYTHYNYIIAFRESGDTASQLNKGMQFYKAGAYEQAISSFMAASESSRQVIDFYLGLCYLELGSYDKSVEYLKIVSESGSDQRYEARWYLALAYLAQGKEKETIKLLESIVRNQQDYFREKAQKLLS
jgi:tetratricopeptide (TPR) repeat protein